MALPRSFLRCDGTMRALTFWPEWAFAVHYLGKPLENRTWAIPKGEWFGLHAGKSIGGTGRIYKDGHRVNEALVEGVEGMGGMAKRAGWSSVGTIRQATFTRGSEVAEWDINRLTASAITGLFRVTAHLHHSDDPWHVPGQIGNTFDYIPLAEPVACKGAQQLWAVPVDVVERMRVAA